MSPLHCVHMRKLILQNAQTIGLNLGVKCGKEFDEGVELLSSIIILNEV